MKVTSKTVSLNRRNAGCSAYTCMLIRVGTKLRFIFTFAFASNVSKGNGKTKAMKKINCSKSLQIIGNACSKQFHMIDFSNKFCQVYFLIRPTQSQISDLI